MSRRLALLSFILLVATGGYLAAFPSATIFYEANVLLHLGLGIALTIAAVAAARRFPRESGALLVCALPAAYLVMQGNTSDHEKILWAHIAFAALAALLIVLRFHRAIAGAWRAALIAALCLFALAPGAAS